ncbi:MAG: hypothetical protein KKF68_00350 [Nanoarchaeota archaeon]|nr:hypothetical protein [Nanoarchaeota archaeon]
MEINLYKEKHQIPGEAVKNIPFKDEKFNKLDPRCVYEGKISLPCFIQKPDVNVPLYVGPFILNQLKEYFLSENLEVAAADDHAFYSPYEGGFQLSLFPHLGTWLGRFEKLRTRTIKTGLFFKKRRDVDVYKDIPSKVNLIGKVKFERFQEINLEKILPLLRDFGFNCNIQTTLEQVEEMWEKMASPSASDIARETWNEKERRDYERTRIWP